MGRGDRTWARSLVARLLLIPGLLPLPPVSGGDRHAQPLSAYFSSQESNVEATCPPPQRRGTQNCVQ